MTGPAVRSTPVSSETAKPVRHAAQNIFPEPVRENVGSFAVGSRVFSTPLPSMRVTVARQSVAPSSSFLHRAVFPALLCKYNRRGKQDDSKPTVCRKRFLERSWILGPINSTDYRYCGLRQACFATQCQIVFRYPGQPTIWRCRAACLRLLAAIMLRNVSARK